MVNIYGVNVSLISSCRTMRDIRRVPRWVQATAVGRCGDAAYLCSTTVWYASYIWAAIRIQVHPRRGSLAKPEVDRQPSLRMFIIGTVLLPEPIVG